jgi:hypothetical protein
MAVRHAMALGAFSLALFSAAAHAGPCTSQIYDADVAISKRLNAAAAAGKTAPETQGALLHHQPTPQSVARAEAQVGDLSEAELKSLTEFMQEARRADEANDTAACQKALADIQQVLGR